MRWLLDLLFPPRCVGCNRRGSWLCEPCRANLPRLPEARCRRCARPLPGVAVCSQCWRQPPPFATISGAFRFEGAIQEAVHRLKFRRSRYLAPLLVDLALVTLGDDWTTTRQDFAVVPVPLHPARQRSRGYNQSALLARELARRVGTDLVAGALVRVRDTPEQARLPAAERWRNVQGAFALADGRLAGRRILLVDDVATTTATLRAAGAVVQRGGAAHVEAFVIARAVSHAP